MRRLASAGAVLALVGALVLVVPAPAFAAAPPGFDPSNNKWRASMLTMLGSVLGNAMPDKWRSEMIANQYALRHSPDALAAATGIGRGNPLDRIPETIEDYTAQEYERQHQRGKVATKGAPATKTGTVAKNIAGVGSTLLAMPLGFQIGSGVAQMFGLDSAGAVCETTPENGTILTQMFTGVDCSAWSLDPEYVPNSDAEVSWGEVSAGGATFRIIGIVTNPTSGARAACLYYNKVGTQTTSFGYLNSAGDWAGSGTPTPLGSGTAAWIRNPCLAAGASNWATEAGFARDPAWPFPRYGIRHTPPGATEAVMVGADPIAGDPDRSIACTLTYTDGSSSTRVSDTYRESTGSVAPVQCPEADPGKTVASVGLTESGGGSTQEIYRQDTTPEYQSYRSAFPECDEQLCLLDLVTTKYPGSVASCFDLVDGCPGWFEDPNKADNYKCVYGSEVVDLDECAVYAALFTPGRQETGSPYSDPLTGTWSGGQNSTTAGRAAMTATNPDVIRQCDLGAFGFNPVDWVVRGGQCLMTWSFVPRPAVVEATMYGSRAAWDNKAPGAIAQWAGGVVLAPSAEGCARSVELMGVTFNVLDNCPGSPMATVAAISRVVTTVGMAFLVIVVLRRQIAGMAGYTQGQS